MEKLYALTIVPADYSVMWGDYSVQQVDLSEHQAQLKVCHNDD
jgi:hypothetical protein